MKLTTNILIVEGGDATQNQNNQYHFKTLVPAVAAGAIIGKGGETIATIQKDTGARVKMSKSDDFYPGTSISHQINYSNVKKKVISENLYVHVCQTAHKIWIFLKLE